MAGLFTMHFLLRDSAVQSDTECMLCCRGRAERMAFADSFTQAYHFRLLYMARALMYPIMGAMRYTHGQEWEVRIRTIAQLAKQTASEHKMYCVCCFL